MSNRLLGLDIVRGIAIVLMVIYHFFYDLEYLGFVVSDMDNHHGWRAFRYLIITLFLLAVGISLVLAHKNNINWKKMLKRSLVLLLSASLISIVSWYFLINNWIYFGILHFIFVASLCGLLFLKLPKVSLILAFIILIGNLLNLWQFDWLITPIYNWLSLPDYSADWVPFIPWFAVVLLGIFVIHRPQTTIILQVQFWQLPLFRPLKYLGRNALVIYLVHQPILFALLLTVRD